MIRTGLLAVVLLLAAAAICRADPPPPDFAEDATADVFATALDFIAPRVLTPVSVQQLALSGLRGLTALDPALVPALQAGRLRLFLGGHVLYDDPAPAADDPEAWGEAAAEMMQAAWLASPAIRKAGEQGVVAIFFDELFEPLDPYSRYVPRAEAEIERSQLAGEAGIGATVAPRRGFLEITGVLPGGPAAAAGLCDGERLIAIDGAPAGGGEAALAIAMLAGSANTRVVLTVRSRHGAERNVTVERAVLAAETVFPEAGSGLLVLRLSGFNDRTGKSLELALIKGLERRPRGVVLDLRGNRGGVLAQAVEVAGAALGSGLVATEAGRDPEADRDLQADQIDLAGGLPVVVLVDGLTASAAEVVAAALADDRRAVVVGSVTQGKGLAQTMTELPNGGELFVTWARVLAPLGWPIQGLGVLPQVCTSLGTAELDRQLAMLRKGRGPMEHALTLNRTARPDIKLADVLAVRQACPAAQGGRDADLRVARFLVSHPDAYAAALIPPQLLPPSPVARSR